MNGSDKWLIGPQWSICMGMGWLQHIEGRQDVAAKAAPAIRFMPSRQAVMTTAILGVNLSIGCKYK